MGSAQAAPATADDWFGMAPLSRGRPQFDARLYAVGVELFEQQRARMPPTFDQELAEFRAQLAAYHRGGADCVDCLGTAAPPA